MLVCVSFFFSSKPDIVLHKWAWSSSWLNLLFLRFASLIKNSFNLTAATVSADYELSRISSFSLDLWASERAIALGFSFQSSRTKNEKQTCRYFSSFLGRVCLRLYLLEHFDLWLIKIRHINKTAFTYAVFFISFSDSGIIFKLQWNQLWGFDGGCAGEVGAFKSERRGECIQQKW